MFTLTLFVLVLAPPLQDCPEGSSRQQMQITSGIADEFAPPTEPTTQSSALMQYPHTYSDFDDPTPNRPFGHTIEGLPCHITSATLTVRVRANATTATDDYIGLMAFPEGLLWTHPMETLVGGAWTTSNTATLTLDLDKLPNGPTRTTSMLHAMSATGRLDLFFHNDTTVDFLSLNIEYCGTGDQDQNGRDDFCEASLECPQDPVITLAPGECCADLLLAPMAADGAVVTNDYDPAQGGTLDACFYPGQTPVTFSRYGADGNIQHCTVVVTVLDNSPPTITLCPRQP